jgi:hypothetical protein
MVAIVGWIVGVVAFVAFVVFAGALFVLISAVLRHPRPPSRLNARLERLKRERF